MRAEMMREWAQELNNGIRIEDVKEHSAKKYWWRCQKYSDHIWEASMDNRSNGSGCPYCANIKVKIGFNDLASANLELSKEWNYKKNKGLLPEMFTKGSGKKVWWICGKGHEWEAIISSRFRGSGCPYCDGNKILVGKTDLATTHSQLVKEWDYERNGNLKPINVSSRSTKDVHWVCKNGHNWQAKVVSRVNKPDCPYCSGRRAIPYETDFMTMYPRLKAEWNPDSELNRGVNPYELVHYKGKYFGWKCEKGHTWSATVSTRIKGSGCPYCAGKKAIKKENDLETLYPEIAKEWDYDKNKKLLPCDVLPGSGRRCHWKCKNGHEWQTAVYNRTKINGTKCPKCTGKQVVVGETDLLMTCADFVGEWDYDKNINISPTMYTRYSDAKVYWKCTIGHSWRASISNRARGNGCPECKKKQGKYI